MASQSTSTSLIYLNITVYAFCYWLSAAVLPFLSKQLDVDAAQFGLLQTVFSAVQLLGGLAIGRVCDSKGPRYALQVSQAGAAASYFLLGTATTIPLLFVSRVPSLFMHAMHAAQAALTDLTTTKNRAAALGRLSLAYGIGQVSGAYLGGLLSQYIGLSYVAILAGVVSLLIMLPNAAILPAHRIVAPDDAVPDNDAAGAGAVAGKVATSPVPGKDGDNDSDGSAGGSGMNFGRIVELMKDAKLRNYILFQIFLGIGVSAYTSMFPYSVASRFGVEASDLGTLQAAGAIVGVFVNTVIVGALSKRFSELRLLQAACVLFAMVFVAFGYVVHNKTHLYFLLVPFGFAGAVYYTVSTTVITRIVPKQDTGTAIGFAHASRSACGMVSPTIGGFIMARYGNNGSVVGNFAASFALMATMFLVLINPALGQATTKPHRE